MRLVNTTSDPIMVAAVKTLLRLIEEGEITSLMYVAAGKSKDAKLGIYGLFSYDLDYATEAASEGFARLVGHKLEYQKTPRVFRKA